MTGRRDRLWTRLVAAFDRGFSALANWELIGFASRKYATSNLDLTLCIERLQQDDPKDLCVALRWLRSMQTPHTSRAASRVLELLRHDDASVRLEAERTRSALQERFGPAWLKP